MKLAMHSPESREKLLTVKVRKLERSLTRSQRAAYARWVAACERLSVPVTTETRHEFLRDLKEDITS